MNKVLLFSFIFFIPITSAIGLTINQQPTNLPNLIPTNNIIAFNNNTAFVNNSVYWQGYIPSTFIPAFVAPSFTTFAYVNNNINNNISALSNTYVQIGNLTPTYVPYSGANKNVNLGSYNLTTTGFIGIGTTTPSQKLDVNGNINLGGNSIYIPGNHYFNFYDSTNEIPVLAVHGTTGYASRIDLTAAGDSTTAVSINAGGYSFFNGGNVGIGTTSPSRPLTVISSSQASYFQGGNGGYTALGFSGDNGITNASLTTLSGNVYIGTSNSAGTGSNGEIIINAATHNVGIGTATPSQALDVIGNTNITGNLSSGGFFGGIDTISTSGVTEIPLNQTLQIVNFSEITLNNGFSLVNNTNLVLNDNLGSGAYDISWSYRAIGSNNHNYLGYIFINGNQINNTFDFEIGQSNNFIRMTGEGQARINAGDNITLRIADTNGTSTIQVYKKQIDIKRIGN